MKKFFSAILAICMLISANIAFADNIVSSDEPVIIKPEYVIISSIQTTFTISSSGRADCYAVVTVPNGYTVDLKVELQRISGGLEIIKTWETSGESRISLDEPWYVLPGHSYRLRVTATTYDSNGNYVESPTEYSVIQEY